MGLSGVTGCDRVAYFSPPALCATQGLYRAEPVSSEGVVSPETTPLSAQRNSKGLILQCSQFVSCEALFLGDGVACPSLHT